MLLGALGVGAFPGSIAQADDPVDLARVKAEADAGKYVVCTITLNSTDERDEMKRRYSQGTAQGRFVFVELTELSKKDDDLWFDEACRAAESQNLRCDQLVISGHFGGGFSGEATRQKLGLAALERHACDQDCGGILQAPDEVFLFGCNTLAGKEKDHRTPRQYIDVLMDHGESRIEAEIITDGRYGTANLSNRDRMTSVFSDAQQLYGFDSVAPLGAHVRSSFKSYLSGIDPVAHLEARKKDRADREIQYFNQQMERALGANFAFCQYASNPLLEDDPRSLSCPLLSGRSSLEDQLHAVEAILASPEPQRFLTLLEAEFGQNLPKAIEHKPLTEEEAASLERISRSPAKEKFLAAIDSAIAMGTGSRAVELADMARVLDWLDPKEYLDRMKPTLLELVRLSASEEDDSVARFLCDPKQGLNRPKLTLTSAEMAQFNAATGSTAAALACVVHPGSGPGSPALAVVEALEAATPGALGSTADGGGKSMSPVALASAMKALHSWYPAGVPDERSARAVSSALTESSVLAGTPPEVWVEGAGMLRSPPLPRGELLKVLETGHRKRQMVTMLASCRLLGRSESTPETRQFLAATMNDPAADYSSCLAEKSDAILAGVPAAEREEWSRRLQQGALGQQDDDSRLKWIETYQRFETDGGRRVEFVRQVIAAPDSASRVKALAVIETLKRNDLPPEARAVLEAAVAADPVLQRNVQYYSR